MSYAIMRIEKIKSYHALSERERHNTREKNVLNADGSKNITVEGHTGLVNRVKALEKVIDKNNSRKTRKDAVRAMEVLFTSDKKFFEDTQRADEYFRLCKEWLSETFGVENIQQVALHKDEEVAHLHAILTTVKEGKFNYSGFVNGRGDLRALQDSFHEKVEHLGLARGEKAEMTQSKYQSTKDWHKSIQNAEQQVAQMSSIQKTQYAVLGVQSQSEIQKLKNENAEINEHYANLARGCLYAYKGNAQKVVQLEKVGEQLRSKELINSAEKDY